MHLPPTEKQIQYALGLGIKDPQLYSRHELSTAIDHLKSKQDKMAGYNIMRSLAKRLGVEVRPRVTYAELKALVRRHTALKLTEKGIVEGEYITYREQGVCLVERYSEPTQMVTLRPVDPKRPRAIAIPGHFVAIYGEECVPPFEGDSK